MGKASRDKGNRFERAVAKYFEKEYGVRIGRVPLSGALHLKSDIYDIDACGFPLYVECKHRENFNFRHVTAENEELINMFDVCKLNLYENEVYFRNQGYKDLPIPVLIFKGGIFKQPMIMYEIKSSNGRALYSEFKVVISKKNRLPLVIRKLVDFNCPPKIQVGRSVFYLQEDDGGIE